MEIKEAIEILKGRIEIYKDALLRTIEMEEVFSEQKKMRYKENKVDYERIIEAFQSILSFLSKIQDAEMPQKSNDHSCIKYASEIASTSNPEPCYACIRKWCNNDFLAYHLKKMGERVDVDRLAKLLYEQHRIKAESYGGKYPTWEQVSVGLKQEYIGDAQAICNYLRRGK